VVAVPTSFRERWVFVDSSAYLALLDASDEHHDSAKRILAHLTEERFRQFVTNAVMMEAHALILSALGMADATAFLRALDRSNTSIIRVRASDEQRAKQIIFQYQDKDFSVVDAISLPVRERLRIGRAFTFDRHFAQFGFHQVSAPAR
jgi:predicted nucleic acid-binding protein